MFYFVHMVTVLHYIHLLYFQNQKNVINILFISTKVMLLLFAAAFLIKPTPVSLYCLLNLWLGNHKLQNNMAH